MSQFPEYGSAFAASFLEVVLQADAFSIPAIGLVERGRW
jgi:hypothetical protein